MNQAPFIPNAIVQWPSELLRQAWLGLPFATRKALLAACGRGEQRYYLDFSLNMCGLALTARELRPILEHPVGRGIYIKCDSHWPFTVLAEQDACRGLMSWLFPAAVTQLGATYSCALAH